MECTGELWLSAEGERLGRRRNERGERPSWRCGPLSFDGVRSREFGLRTGNGGRASARAQSERARGKALGRRGKGKEETLILEANFGVGRAQGLIAMEMDGVVLTACPSDAGGRSDHVESHVGIVQIISAPAGAEIYFRTFCQISHHKPHVWTK